MQARSKPPENRENPPQTCRKLSRTLERLRGFAGRFPDCGKGPCRFAGGFPNLGKGRCNLQGGFPSPGKLPADLRGVSGHSDRVPRHAGAYFNEHPPEKSEPCSRNGFPEIPGGTNDLVRCQHDRCTDDQFPAKSYTYLLIG